MSARLRLHGPATLVSLAVILALAVVALVALSGAEAAAPGTAEVRRHDHHRHDPPPQPRQLPQQRHHHRRRQHHPRPELPHDRRRRDSPAAGCGPEEDCDLGVASIGHDGVTVVHGSVREFAIGVAVAGFVGNARHNRVLGISSSKNDFFGIGFFGVARSVIRNSSSSHNIPPEGDGIGLFASNHVRIVHNKIRHNPGPGIHVADSNREPDQAERVLAQQPRNPAGRGPPRGGPQPGPTQPLRSKLCLRPR